MAAQHMEEILMRRWGHIALCSATALFAFVLAAAPLSAAPAYVPGEVIVKFRPGASAAAIAAIRADLGGTVKRELALTGAVCLKLTGLEVEEAVAKYRGDPAIEYLEPNYLWQADVIPNDARFGELWGLHNLGQSGGTADADVDAPEAWDSETGSSDVIVAVIDTGVDYAHPDLAANRWVNTGEMAGNGVDDDHNGFIDDVHGYDFVNNDGNPMDDHSHGTHCAGTIGAVGNNGIGVAGVCWQVRIMAVKFLDAGGGGTTDAAIASVEYAVQMGADILSNSWGGGGYSEALRDAIVAAETAGILFVAAAGNSASNNDTYPHYPASYDVGNIVSVAATDRNDALADFSCWGPLSVDLAAPGVDVFSTMPSAYYDYKSGTSMACPHVSGALALIKARFPGISGASARTLLLNTVNAVPGLAGVVATGGRLNVAAVMAGPDTIPPAPIPDLAATAVSGQWADLAWTATGDDGSTGTAAAYELRFATFPIDSLNFASATLATGLPAPRAAGAAESHRVRGLAFGTDYWFAIRARDEYGLPSPVVSAAMATTAPPPAITAPTDTLAAVLYPGGSTTRVLTIGNTGQSDLVWSAAVEAVDVLIARARGARFTTQDFPHTSPTLPAPGANGTAAAPPPFAKRVYSRELKVVTGPQVLLLVTVDPLNNAYGTALQNLGLEHTLVTSWPGLEAELASATWDLVIIDSYNFWTTSGGLDQLVAHLDQGGAL
ncbi:hypothetical protein FJ250_05070, partial [bacterium]|nr:hypothetical protein [bacterium]